MYAFGSSLSISIEDADRRLDRRNDRLRRCEIFQPVRRAGLSAEASSDVDMKPALELAVGRPDLCDRADVVNRNPGVIIAAAFECNFEFPRQILIEGVPQKIFGY